jgi:hypothetical protein
VALACIGLWQDSRPLSKTAKRLPWTLREPYPAYSLPRGERWKRGRSLHGKLRVDLDEADGDDSMHLLSSQVLTDRHPDSIQDQDRTSAQEPVLCARFICMRLGPPTLVLAHHTLPVSACVAVCVCVPP